MSPEEQAEARCESKELFDWQTAEYVGLDVVEAEMERRKGRKRVDIGFHVRAGSKTYCFDLDKCQKIDRGWICSGGIRFRGEEDEKQLALRTAGEATQAAFAALKENDFGTFATLLPTDAEMEWVLAPTVESDDPEELERERRAIGARGGFATLRQGMRESAEKRFNEVRARSAKVIDWASAEFESVDYRLCRVILERGVATGALCFRVRAGEKLHQFELLGRIKAERRCFCSVGIVFLDER